MNAIGHFLLLVDFFISVLRLFCSPHLHLVFHSSCPRLMREHVPEWTAVVWSMHALKTRAYNDEPFGKRKQNSCQQLDLQPNDNKAKYMKIDRERKLEKRRRSETFNAESAFCSRFSFLFRPTCAADIPVSYTAWRPTPLRPSDCLFSSLRPVLLLQINNNQKRKKVGQTSRFLIGL